MKTKRFPKKMIRVFLFVVTSTALICSCEKENDTTFTSVHTNSFVTELGNVIPEICYGDSVWFDNSTWGSHETICCVPLEEGRFYCYADYDEGYGTAGNVMFQNGWTYEYIYCRDGSDSLMLREWGLTDANINILKESSHILVTKMTDPSGNVSNSGYCRVWLTEVRGDRSVMLTKFPPRMSTDIPNDDLQGFIFTKTMLTR